MDTNPRRRTTCTSTLLLPSSYSASERILPSNIFIFHSPKNTTLSPSLRLLPAHAPAHAPAPYPSHLFSSRPAHRRMSQPHLSPSQRTSSFFLIQSHQPPFPSTPSIPSFSFDPSSPRTLLALMNLHALIKHKLASDLPQRVHTKEERKKKNKTHSPPHHPPKPLRYSACTAVIARRFSVSDRWAASCASWD